MTSDAGPTSAQETDPRRDQEELDELELDDDSANFGPR